MADLSVLLPFVALCSGARQGKDKPTFSPWKDMGDVVVVKNARHVEFTGRKWDQKVYRWHTGCALASPGRANRPAASEACAERVSAAALALKLQAGAQPACLAELA
jgi:ribosomal protein L13